MKDDSAADGDYMKYLGYKLDHHPTSFVWLLVVVHCAWDLCKEETVPTNELYIYKLDSPND